MKKEKSIYPTFTCAVCIKKIKTKITNEEAEATAKQRYGVENASTDNNMSVICDICFVKIFNKDGTPKKDYAKLLQNYQPPTDGMLKQ